MERKIYGETPTFNGPRIPSNDPEFDLDSQNNDEFYQYDTDVPNGVDRSGDLD